MQWGQGNHTQQEMPVRGAVWSLCSAVLQHSLLRSCTSPHNNTESKFLSVQVPAARSLRSVSNNSLYSCLFLMFIFHFQPPTDMSLAAPDSFQCSHSPLHAAWALFPFTFSLHPSAVTQKTLTKPEAHWALTALDLIAVQNPGKHQLLNVSQQHQHLPPCPRCQGCYFQIF